MDSSLYLFFSLPSRIGLLGGEIEGEGEGEGEGKEEGKAHKLHMKRELLMYILCVIYLPYPLSLLSFHPSKPSPSVLFLILLYLPLWHYNEYGIHCSIRKCGYVSNLDKVLFSITTIGMFHCTTSLMAHVRCYITRKTS